MTGFAVLIIACLGLQVVLKRDKRDRKRFEQIGKMIEQERKRRAKEEKLKAMRVQHPKVIYLDDRRHSIPTKQRIS